MYYRRTQIGWVTIAITGLMLVLLAFSAARMPRQLAFWDECCFVGIGSVLLCCMVIFGSLTVTVDEASVTVQFGPGPIRKKIPLADVESCQPVRNRWWWGWGIRCIPGGWLYNVSGLDAVELVMKDGRVFRIGSDEPQALAAFIQGKLKRLV